VAFYFSNAGRNKITIDKSSTFYSDHSAPYPDTKLGIFVGFV